MHGNIGIQPGETRLSFTQYTSGGLFRYVDYGFRSWKALQVEDKEVADEWDAKRGSRWMEQLAFFSKEEEVDYDREHVGLSK